MKKLLTLALILTSMTLWAKHEAFVGGKWIVVNDCYKNIRGGYSASIGSDTVSANNCRETVIDTSNNRRPLNRVSNKAVFTKSSGQTHSLRNNKNQVLEINSTKKQ